jgi:GNAT superfamily N-acetyltransferase
MPSLNAPKAASEPLLIRDAVFSDSIAMCRLLGELGFPSAPDTITHRLRSMQAFGESVMVAELSGKVVGLLTLHVMQVLHRAAPIGRVSALVVTETERSKGVGKALVEAGEQLLKERGCKIVEVTSNLRLQEAHSFYRCIGFEETSLRFKKNLV